MPTFFCKSCYFKYTPRTLRNDPPKTCNNCGGVGTVEKQPDANQIIKESEYY